MIAESARRFTAHLRSLTHLEPMAGVVALIRELYQNNVPIAVASSAVRDNIEYVLATFQLTDYFPVQVSGGELEHSKPHPEIFLHTAKLLKKTPANCVVIEDSRNGALAAKAAGMKCIGFQPPGAQFQDLSAADLVIRSFSEINLEKMQQLW